MNRIWATVLSVGLLALTTGGAAAIDAGAPGAVEIADLEVVYAGTWNPAGRGEATASWTVMNHTDRPMTVRQEVVLAGPGGFDRRVTSPLTPSRDAVIEPGRQVAFAASTSSWPVWMVDATVTVRATSAAGVVEGSPVTLTGHDAGAAIPRPQILLMVTAVLAALLVDRLRRERAAAQDPGPD